MLDRPHYLNIETFSSSYLSFQPILCFCSSSFVVLYGLSIWDSIHKSYLSKLQTFQNKAVKIIGGGKYMDNATPFYYKLKILKIPDFYRHEVAKLVFYHHHQRLPSLPSKFFTKTNQNFQKPARLELPIILPYMIIFLFTKQSNFKKASAISIKVLKVRTRFQPA